MAASPLQEPLSGAGYVLVGPFLSSTDAVTPITDLSIAVSDVRLSKNNGDFAPKNEATPPAHDAAGWYRIILDATDVDTTGYVVIAINVAGALPVQRKFAVTAQPA